MSAPSRRHWLRGRDRGAATAEMLIWVAAAVMLLGLAVYVIRGVSAAIDVGNTAESAARAASLAASPAQAKSAARAVVTADLAAANSACHHTETVVDVSRFRPGGTVTVTVSCVIVVADLPIGGLGSRTVVESASAPIDAYKVIRP